jgi:hypothetical protein
MDAGGDAGAVQRARCGQDLLAVLAGGGGAPHGVSQERAARLEACLRRLPPPPAPPALRRLAARLVQAPRDAARHELRRALAPPRVPVPDVEGAALCRCTLTRTPFGRRFAAQPLQRHFAAVFAAAAAGAPRVGLPLSLSRFDLFHGHLFAARGCVGLLLHAREYPRRAPPAFDVHLGHCQAGSTLEWDEREMALRNILYVVPVGDGGRALPPALAVLCTAPGSLLHDELLAPGVRLLHTAYEEDLGVPLGDVNYLHAAPRVPQASRLFVCM